MTEFSPMTRFWDLPSHFFDQAQLVRVCEDSVLYQYHDRFFTVRSYWEPEGISPILLQTLDTAVRLRFPNFINLRAILFREGRIDLVTDSTRYNLRNLSGRSLAQRQEIFPKLMVELLRSMVNLEDLNLDAEIINPERIVISGGNFKFSIFNQTGTILNYLPPEILLGKVSLTGTTWSLGATLYEFLTGFHLFPKDESSEIILIRLSNLLDSPLIYTHILNDTITGQVPLDKILDLSWLNSRYREAFLAMFTLNSRLRPRGKALLTLLGLEVPSKVPQVFLGTRRIADSHLRIILNLNPTSSGVLSVEILTRYNGKTGRESTLPEMGAALSLGSKYLDTPTLDLSQVSQNLGIPLSDLVQAESEILIKLSLSVYNLDLFKRLQELNKKEDIPGYLRSLPFEYFNQSLSSWF